MTALSDTLTIALVIVLLFGSIALYLYTRIQQAEQKINLLENILLDLKTSSEVKSYMDLPADGGNMIDSEPEGYKSYTSSSPVSVNSDEDIAPGCNIDCKTPVTTSSYKPMDNDDDLETDSNTGCVASYDDSDHANNLENILTQNESTKMSVNYESMTLKELQSIAKQRGISGASSMKKGPIIEALKTSDRATSVDSIEPGSLSGTSSFVETSSFLVQE